MSSADVRQEPEEGRVSQSRLVAVAIAECDARVAFAADYGEVVVVLRVERLGKRKATTRYTIMRANGSATYNYPGYLLSRVRRVSWHRLMNWWQQPWR